MLGKIILSIMLEICLLLMENVVAMYSKPIFTNLAQIVNTVFYGPLIEEIAKYISIKFGFDNIFIPIFIITETIFYFLWYNKLSIDKKYEATGNSYFKLVIYRIEGAIAHLGFWAAQLFIYKLIGLRVIGLLVATLMHMIFNGYTFFNIEK